MAIKTSKLFQVNFYYKHGGHPPFIHFVKAETIQDALQIAQEVCDTDKLSDNWEKLLIKSIEESKIELVERFRV